MLCKPSDSDELDIIPVHHISLNLNASEVRLERVRIATQADVILSQLKHQIFQGWPETRRGVTEALYPYWTFREELSVEDGLIFKAQRLVIPTSQRSAFLTDLHLGHFGEEKTLLRARESVYWPGITEDIRQFIKGCNSCQATQPSQQKEPMISHNVPSRPWKKVGMDLFEHKSHHYLLVADYFSKFPFVSKLNNLTSNHVISLLKTIFSEQGIPSEVYTDQGTQFTSSDFKNFAKLYRFGITHSSPRYPQSNGFIESMVKIVKRTISKAEESGIDPHLALLRYRTTPIKPGIPSPAEMMTQRKFKELLPVKQQLLSNLSSAREKMIQHKQFQTELYNHTAKPLPDLAEQQPVRVQLDPKRSSWQPATIMSTPTDKSPRAYEIQTESGAKYTHNRRFIRPAELKCTNQPPDQLTKLCDLSKSSNETTTCDVPPSSKETPTIPSVERPKRNIRPPDRLNIGKDCKYSYQ